jgi:hypothetical protein
MVPDEKSDVMQVGATPAESPTLLLQCGIAALGVGLLALPFLQAIGVNCLVIPASALGGGAARSRLVCSSEHQYDGTRTPLVIGHQSYRLSLRTFRWSRSSSRRTGR